MAVLSTIKGSYSVIGRKMISRALGASRLAFIEAIFLVLGRNP